MKTFRERFSVTKIVLLIVIIALIFIEIWKVVKGEENSDLFSNVVIAIVSFYFGQKGIQYDEVDSIIEKSDLDNNDKL